MSSMIAATLPWPDEWSTRKRIGLYIGCSYLGLMGVVSLYFGVAGLVAGELVHVPILLVGGAFCLLVVVQGVLTRLFVPRGVTRAIRAATVSETREKVIIFPYSASQFWLFFAQVAIVLCGVAVPIAAASVVAALDVRDVGSMVIAFASVVAVGYLAALMAQFLRKKIARGYVAVGAAGIYHRSWAFTSFAPWQHVIDVWPFEDNDRVIRVQVAANPEGWTRRTSRFWKQPESSFGPNLTVRTMYLSVDPALVYHALRFYFNNPRARSELSGDAAVRRLKRADIPVPPRSLRGGTR